MRYYAVQSISAKAPAGWPRTFSSRPTATCQDRGNSSRFVEYCAFLPALFDAQRPMEQDPDPHGQSGKAQPEKPPKDWLRWATTPPQSYGVYLVCLVLVWVVSFYAGTLKPKNTGGLGPPPVIAPPR
jgi:hypothetical protein